MNAAFGLLPVLIIRFAVMGILDKTALRRADVFPKPAGKGKAALAVYMVTNILLFLCPFFLKIITGAPLFYIALGVYAFGTAVYLLAVWSFARPEAGGINKSGLYRYSRNPMYVGYFFYFLGLALLTQSPVLLVILILFQIATHWIILAEEQWCLLNFGEDYINYMKKVRRYL
jgi:protein-S-isoprenylcysteine O-methyltransferase Ste14